MSENIKINNPYRRDLTPGEKVAARRKELGWTQEELEYRSDVSIAHIGRIENNRVRPGVEIIEKLEKALGIALRKDFENYEQHHEYKKRNNRASKKMMRVFARKVADKNLNEEELQEILDDAISKIDSIDE